MHFPAVQLGGLAPTPPITYIRLPTLLFRFMAICTHVHGYMSEKVV